MRSQKKKDGKLIGGANASVDLSDVDYIDLGGMILDGRSGSTGIRFRPGYEPVKYQFGVVSTGPWHDTMGANDKYRRDSLDGGTTWGDPYQFRGTNGSDANVPAWVKSIQATYIDNQWVIAPHIYGGEITSETTINVGTDATIGRWLKLKSEDPEQYIGILFNGDSIGTTPGIYSYNNRFITMTAQYLNFIGDGLKDSHISISTPNLDLTYVQNIKWGNNAPVAVFA